jgi:hypothetical protein
MADEIIWDVGIAPTSRTFIVLTNGVGNGVAESAILVFHHGKQNINMDTMQNISLAFSPSFVGNAFRMDSVKE